VVPATVTRRARQVAVVRHAAALAPAGEQHGEALAIFLGHDQWQRGKTKDWRSFLAIPGSEPGLLHMTDCRECSCPDFQRARNVCKHVRAVRLWMTAYKSGAVAPRPRPAAPTRYDALYPSCRVAGCQDEPEPRSQDCYCHQLVDAF